MKKILLDLYTMHVKPWAEKYLIPLFDKHIKPFFETRLKPWWHWLQQKDIVIRGRKIPATWVAVPSAFVLLLMIRSGIDAIFHSPPPPPPAMTIGVRRIKPQEFETSLTLSGSTIPYQSVFIIPQTSRIVEKIIVPKGNIVKKGDLLMKLELRDLLARKKAAETRLQEKQKVYEAGQKLFKGSFKSQNAQIAAKADLDAAEAQLAAIEDELKQCTLYAPFDGLVEEVHVDEGSYIPPMSNQAVIDFIQLNPLKIVCFVSQQEKVKIKKGAKALVQFPLFNNSEKEWEAKVISIREMADAKTRTYRIELEMDNPDATIPSGLTTIVKITTGNEKAYQIPTSCITLDDQGVIGVKIWDQKVHFVPVTLLQQNEESFWVSGIHGTPLIITEGQDFVKDGEKNLRIKELLS